MPCRRLEKFKRAPPILLYGSVAQLLVKLEIGDISVKHQYVIPIFGSMAGYHFYSDYIRLENAT